eukprot:687039-Rhodomonas_salina.1
MMMMMMMMMMMTTTKNPQLSPSTKRLALRCVSVAPIRRDAADLRPEGGLVNPSAALLKAVLIHSARPVWWSDFSVFKPP